MKVNPINKILDLLDILSLFLFVALFSIEKVLNFIISKLSIRKKIDTIQFAKKFGKRKESRVISLYNLVSLAFRQVFYRRSRAYITIGAIAFAMGIIVLLVSLGYGAQNAVVERVADDRELSVIDVLPEVGSRRLLDPGFVRELHDVDGVAKVLPMVSVVGDVKYEGADSDVVVYGVTSDYIYYSESIREGEVFEFNEIPEKSVKYLGVEDGNVEGVADTQVELIELESPEEADENVVTVQIESDVPFDAIVSERFLSTLGIDPNGAVGEEFNLSFVPLKDLVGDGSVKVVSNSVKYKIVGVVDGDAQSIIYVPLEHIWSMGVVKFSQAKVITKENSDVEEVRATLESMGMITKSIVDVIEQIEAIFRIVRIALLAVGLGALVIASLGMFNTLTVSLLERSREIGLLKVMGMRSEDVYRLFITESLIMGIWGGVGGILVAFIGGKFLSILLSTFTLARGGQFVDISYIPLSFLITSLVLIIGVGILTGLYPARRATKISAIDALRYE